MTLHQAAGYVETVAVTDHEGDVPELLSSSWHKPSTWAVLVGHLCNVFVPV